MTMKNYNKINKTYIHADALSGGSTTPSDPGSIASDPSHIYLYTTKEEIDSINETPSPLELPDITLAETHNATDRRWMRFETSKKLKAIENWQKRLRHSPHLSSLFEGNEHINRHQPRIVEQKFDPFTVKSMPSDNEHKQDTKLYWRNVGDGTSAVVDEYGRMVIGVNKLATPYMFFNITKDGDGNITTSFKKDWKELLVKGWGVCFGSMNSVDESTPETAILEMLFESLGITLSQNSVKLSKELPAFDIQSLPEDIKIICGNSAIILTLDEDDSGNLFYACNCIVSDGHKKALILTKNGNDWVLPFTPETATESNYLELVFEFSNEKIRPWTIYGYIYYIDYDGAESLMWDYSDGGLFSKIIPFKKGDELLEVQTESPFNFHGLEWAETIPYIEEDSVLPSK